MMVIVMNAFPYIPQFLLKFSTSLKISSTAIIAETSSLIQTLRHDCSRHLGLKDEMCISGVAIHEMSCAFPSFSCMPNAGV